ncbi:forkhead activin signal transducer 3-like [Ranitomeya variabilis]|uniref:forkhead activin signal transducer 3-like n=1 Tax=Ranitomeya variabilis TaxID=490064 RepID=UPI0040560727
MDYFQNRLSSREQIILGSTKNIHIDAPTIGDIFSEDDTIQLRKLFHKPEDTNKNCTSIWTRESSLSIEEKRCPRGLRLVNSSPFPNDLEFFEKRNDILKEWSFWFIIQEMRDRKRLTKKHSKNINPHQNGHIRSNIGILETLPQLQPWETIKFPTPNVFSIEQIPEMDSNMDDGQRQENTAQTSYQEEKTSRKKKNYQRYPKPPYSYLAMIALVIQKSPEKKLKLTQILEKISEFCPLFKGEYQGWKDSVRHNLSSNDCFRKVLKDPHKPQAKGNFWTVDVSRIPADAMKIQNTAVTGQHLYPHDLAPFIIHGQPYGLLDYNPPPLQNTEPNRPEAAAPATSPSSDPASCFPMILWNLPTSYSRCLAPNVVAPPSIHPLVLYPNFPSIPLYNTSPSYSNSPYTSCSNSPAQTPSSPRSQFPLTPRPLESSYPPVDFPPNRSVFEIPGYLTHAGNLLRQGQ